MLKRKGKNFYFRLNKKGIKEIFELAGPFADSSKNKWFKLLLEKAGEKVMEMLKKYKMLDVEELCIKLRILPGTIRKALRNLEKERKVGKIKKGKKFYWKIL